MEEVQLSEDPYDDLPQELLAALERVVHAAPASDDGDRTSKLMRVARTAIVDDGVGALIAELSVDSDGETADLGRLLRIHVDALGDEEERTRRWAALWDLLGDWVELHGDHEKLFGHLSLKHDAQPSAHASFEELLDLHTRTHQSGHTSASA